MAANKYPIQESDCHERLEGGGNKSKTHDSGFVQNSEIKDTHSSSVDPRHFHALQSPQLSAASTPGLLPIEAQGTASACCSSFTCRAEQDRLRRQLERATAENALLLRENSEMMRTIVSMQRTLTCSQIVEGHSHLQEKCQELQSELNHVIKINENTSKSDENKSERIELLQTRLKEVQLNLNKKDVYIELLHEELAGLFQHSNIGTSDTQQLQKVNQELEQQLKSAQVENESHLKELLDFLAQIKELKDTMSTLRDELEKERDIRRDIVRRTSSNKDRNRPLSVPVFCDKTLQ